MRVRILVSIAGLDFSYVPGQIVDMPDDKAAAWIDGGNAERVGRETAAKEQNETAVMGKARRRKK